MSHNFQTQKRKNGDDRVQAVRLLIHATISSAARLVPYTLCCGVVLPPRYDVCDLSPQATLVGFPLDMSIAFLSCAQVATRVPQEIPSSEFWRAGRETVRRVEALEPSALLEVHLGIRSTRFYQEVTKSSMRTAQLHTSGDVNHYAKYNSCTADPEHSCERFTLSVFLLCSLLVSLCPFQQISSTSQESAELIEVLTPIGVKPGVCRYLGPSVHFPE